MYGKGSWAPGHRGRMCVSEREREDLELGMQNTREGGKQRHTGSRRKPQKYVAAQSKFAEGVDRKYRMCTATPLLCNSKEPAACVSRHPFCVSHAHGEFHTVVSDPG